MCRNLNLGLTTKAKACKGASWEWSSGVTFHAHGSVGKYEGMSTHTPKCTPLLLFDNPFVLNLCMWECCPFVNHDNGVVAQWIFFLGVMEK